MTVESIEPFSCQILDNADFFDHRTVETLMNVYRRWSHARVCVCVVDIGKKWIIKVNECTKFWTLILVARNFKIVCVHL